RAIARPDGMRAFAVLEIHPVAADEEEAGVAVAGSRAGIPDETRAGGREVAGPKLVPALRRGPREPDPAEGGNGDGPGALASTRANVFDQMRAPRRTVARPELRAVSRIFGVEPDFPAEREQSVDFNSAQERKEAPRSGRREVGDPEFSGLEIDIADRQEDTPPRDGERHPIIGQGRDPSGARRRTVARPDFPTGEKHQPIAHRSEQRATGRVADPARAPQAVGREQR